MSDTPPRKPYAPAIGHPIAGRFPPPPPLPRRVAARRSGTHTSSIDPATQEGRAWVEAQEALLADAEPQAQKKRPATGSP